MVTNVKVYEAQMGIPTPINIYNAFTDLLEVEASPGVEAFDIEAITGTAASDPSGVSSTINTKSNDNQGISTDTIVGTSTQTETSNQ